MDYGEPIHQTHKMRTYHSKLSSTTKCNFREPKRHIYILYKGPYEMLVSGLIKQMLIYIGNYIIIRLLLLL